MTIEWRGAQASAGRVALRAGLASRALSTLLVASVFVTHWRLPILGLHFLPEHFVVLALLAALVLEGKASVLWAIATDRTSVVLAAFIAWGGLVTLLQAPDVGESLPIIGWLGLDWLMLVALVASFADAEELERLAVTFATALAAIAVGLGIAAGISGGSFGTAPGFYGEGRPVVAISYEPNILASTVAIWAFVGLSSSYPRVRAVARFCVPPALGAIAFSLTRAVIIGFGIGLLAWALIGGRRAARTMTKVLAATLVLGVIALAVAPGVAAPVRQRFEHLFDLQSGTEASRGDQVRLAASDLGGPQLAVGLGTNTYGQRHVQPSHPENQDYLSVLPVQIVYDSGLIGAGLLVLALVTVRPWSRPGRARAVGVLLIYASAATATSPFWLGSSWMLIALAVITRPGGSPARGDQPP